jgi:cyclophilin family peptidyl-prolyl cis-trans isomerase
MKKSLALLILLLATVLSSCGGPGGSDEVVTIKTSYGDMVVILYDETPKHKENFLKLAKEKYYDSLLFHRVIAGFMLQGGDPDSKKATPDQMLGQGGPGYTVPAEINANFYHEKGALAAARLSDQQNPEKESSGSQFYIVQGRIIPEIQLRIDQQKMQGGLQQMYQSGQYKPLFDSLDMIYRAGDMEAYQTKIASIVPEVEKATGIKVSMDVSPEKLKAYSTIGGVAFLDNQYTVFGKVIQGLDVIDKICAVQTNTSNGSDRPFEDVRMTMTVKKMSKKQIEKEYGYKYPDKKE